MEKFDLIIVGAGAAGLMCAVEANKRGRRVLLLDQAEKVGQKIRISGGGRANFTNVHTTPDNFLSNNPRFCVSALKRYAPDDFIAFVNKHGIAWHERNHGQLFCDGPAQQITDMLLREAEGVTVQTSTHVSNIDRSEAGFRLQTGRGECVGDALVIATGGPSIPKMGSSGFGYDVARQFGLKVVEPRPGLVPLTFAPELSQRLAALAGVSLEALVTLGKVQFIEALLFTHRGLSGPAILQISSYWRKGDAIIIDLVPGEDVFAYLKAARANEPRKEASTALSQMLPKRVAQMMAELTACEGSLAEIGDKSLRRLAAHINAWSVTPDGSEGMRTAEVTVGGVDTRDLSSKTMEARSVPGLFFIGETVDVTGHLGGFNFQWAWASGHACGEVV
jgi:predicted Rossmann fold flavoprotein